MGSNPYVPGSGSRYSLKTIKPTATGLKKLGDNDESFWNMSSACVSEQELDGFESPCAWIRMPLHSLKTIGATATRLEELRDNDESFWNMSSACIREHELDGFEALCARIRSSTVIIKLSDQPQLDLRN